MYVAICTSKLQYLERKLNMTITVDINGLHGRHKLTNTIL